MDGYPDNFFLSLSRGNCGKVPLALTLSCLAVTIIAMDGFWWDIQSKTVKLKNVSVKIWQEDPRWTFRGNLVQEGLLSVQNLVRRGDL